ncbi:MAG: ferritin family protein [Candidatus Scalindua sp.]|jgi:rubrerythrin
MATVNTLKEILDRATQNEVNAYAYYSQAVDIVKDPSAKVLLKEFADIELKHKIKLENFDLSKIDEEHHKLKQPHDLHISEYLLEKEIQPDSTIQEIMIHAMKKEQKSYEFYNDMAKVVSSIEVKNLFEELAAEELDHKGRIETEYDDVIYKEF